MCVIYESLNLFMYIINLRGYINDNINMFVLGKNLIKLKKYMKC